MPATTVLASRPAEVLETAEAFKEVDGEYKFAGTLIVERMITRTMHIRRLTTHLLPKSKLEVGAEANITITSIRFSLAIKFNIYLELIEKVYIFL